MNKLEELVQPRIVAVRDRNPSFAKSDVEVDAGAAICGLNAAATRIPDQSSSFGKGETLIYHSRLFDLARQTLLHL